MKILGISAYYHDSAAALIEDGVILAAAQEERFTRKKHDASFPENAITFCLGHQKMNLSDLDAIVFYDKPFLKLERLLETYYNHAPLGWWQFINAMPAWLGEKLFLKSTIKKALKEIGDVDFKKTELLFSEHHLSHAASTYYPSGFEDAAILTIDGVGEWATASICHGKGSNIEVKKELHFPHSLGLLYSSFTYFLGFKVNSGEYKLMGLAPYGNPDAPKTQEYISLIKKELLTINTDASFKLNPTYFKYSTSLKMIKTDKWERLFGLKLRQEEDELTQDYCNLAYAIQQLCEEVVLLLAKEAQRVTGSKNLCLAGGVALNCVANGKLKEAGIFENIFVQPASGDAGGAVGSALAASFIKYDAERKPVQQNHSCFGPSYGSLEIKRTLERNKLVFEEQATDDIIANTAMFLSNAKVVGWFQGAMEFGPRALGHRSILADPTNSEMQLKLNLKIKKRESFRPFAPVMLEEEMAKYFDENDASPFMLFVHRLKEEYRKEVPADLYEMPLIERLNVPRSSLQAVTHLDFSARIQTVNESQNQKMYRLLHEFKSITGVGVLANTSFNVRGEPIVCSPQDAINCFMSTDMDVLVLGDFILLKENQAKELFSSYEQTFKKD